MDRGSAHRPYLQEVSEEPAIATRIAYDHTLVDACGVRLSCADMLDSFAVAVVTVIAVIIILAIIIIIIIIIIIVIIHLSDVNHADISLYSSTTHAAQRDRSQPRAADSLGVIQPAR